MMKTTLSLLASAALATTAFASAGPGPWANSTWYPGSLDGKYQAAVYGNNVSGVIGFAVANGTTTVSTNTTTTTNATTSTVIWNPNQNYYAIFVEGRAYTGLTMASINFNSSTINGVLLPPAAIMTGGYFSANIDDNRGVFTFNGNGEISFSNAAPPPTLVNIPFMLNGIRVSFTPNP